MNRIFTKMVEHQKLLRIVVVLAVVAIAMIATFVGAEAGPWDTGP
jgi:hypothetical protein